MSLRTSVVFAIFIWLSLPAKAQPGPVTSSNAVILASDAPTATLTIDPNSPGNTPDLLAYNSGHFYPGSNTKDWWRYAGVSGARVFLTADLIEATDDIPGRGDGVTDQGTFLARRAALRANPNSPIYINWTYFNGRYNTIGKHGANRFQPNDIFTELRKLGVQIDANIGASQYVFTISDTNDWAGKWELWQHFYAQAFYLGRQFEVQRYQMFNEPDHSNAGGLTQEDYLQRLQLCSDAIQCGLTDVNSIYGKSLRPKIIAPVITTASFSGWGSFVVTNRHLNFLTQTDTNFSLLHQYDYHQYNPAPAIFGANLARLRNDMASAMVPEAPFPISLSEFNVHTAAFFDTMPETLDYPTKYPRLASIAVNLLQNGAAELYNFKFSQTDGDVGDNYPVRKNGMHYVDNENAPYNIGGITKAGEVWRLLNKAFAPGRERLDVGKSLVASGLDVHASYDPVSRKYFVFSANYTTNDLSFNLDLSALNIRSTSKMLVEEVSESIYGAGKTWTTVATAESTPGTQGANTVWLITISTEPQQPEMIILSTQDAEVRDGANKGKNYGAITTLSARNDPTNTSNRRVGFLKFQLPTNNLANLEFAVLSLQASCATVATTAQAHVYGITNNNWTQNTVTWSNAPNLKSNVTNGVTISRQFINGQGTNASIVGQLVVSSTTPSEKLIDVTSYLRQQSNITISFLISQDPRWNVTLPSLEAGDTQPDGVTILSSESGNGPRLRLIFKTNTTNGPPVAINDTYTNTQNQALVVSDPGILSNDLDSNGDPLNAILLSSPANGTLVLSSNGGFSYTPAADYYGSDSFTYKAGDGQSDSRTATVFILLDAPGSKLYQTNLLVNAEAFVRGGSNGDNDQDEVATGYILIKHYDSPYDSSRKAYFQFDLAGKGADLETQAIFSVTTHTVNAAQRVQLWALNQAYTNFSAGITWNNAQANALDSNDLLTNGPLHATRIGEPVLFTSTASSTYTFTIPRLGDYAFSNRITFGLSGVEDAANSAGGLRLARNNASLQITGGLFAPQITTQPMSRTNTAGTTAIFAVSVSGAAPLSYQWRKNGVNLMNGSNVSGARSPTLTLTSLTQQDTASYSVIASNSVGLATSAPAVLSVTEPPPTRFTSPTILPDGRFRTVLTGVQNNSFIIETSTNLTNWLIVTNINNHTGDYEFIDGTAAEHPYRFYRAR